MYLSYVQPMCTSQQKTVQGHISCANSQNVDKKIAKSLMPLLLRYQNIFGAGVVQNNNNG